MTKISYTADIARKDMSEVFTLRAKEQSRKYKEGLEKTLKTHFDNLSTTIKNAATKGCSSTTYNVYDLTHNKFIYETQTIAPLVLEELINAGYEVDFTKESNESDKWCEFYIHW